MGRSIKNQPVVTDSKLVSAGEYVMTPVFYSSEVSNATIWTYNYPKQKSSTETFLYMSAHWNSLETYSYAPAPCIRCENQTANGYNGSNYFFGYTAGGEREFNLHTCMNIAHSQSLNGFSGNISGSNFNAGTVPIIIRWETANGSGNRPGWHHCPPKNGTYGGGNDTRGQTNWYGYLRVWEIKY